MNSPLTAQLKTRLYDLPFHAYEQCLNQLLTKMGYENVALCGRTKTRQYTAHGGRDMEALARTGVTAARIILQAKQYRRPVSRRFVDELRGTLLRLNARQGLLISTSTFSSVARQAAETTGSPIQLVDGDALAQLLVSHRIGVRIRDGLRRERLSLDRAYFDALATQYP